MTATALGPSAPLSEPRASRRILVIDGAPPDREASAGERATFDQVESLLGLGHDVVLTAFGGLSDAPERVARMRSQGLPVARRIASGPDHIAELLDGSDWDAAIVHRPGPALAATAILAARPKIATVFWGHDIHSWRMSREPGKGTASSRRRAQLARIAEERCWRTYTLSVYPTSREAEAVSGRPESAGRGRAVPYYRLAEPDLPALSAERAGTAPGAPSCLWVGSAAHAPNLDAVDYAVTQLVPMLRAADPAALLTIVGDWPAAVRARYETAGVEFAGRVSEAELRSLHQRHTCLLAPLRFGAGSRRKLVGAMGLGLPVVTTSEGVRGLLVRDATDADGLAVADDPAGLVAAVLALTRRPRRAAGQAQRAQAAVADCYGAANFDIALDRLLDEAVRRSRTEREGAHG